MTSPSCCHELSCERLGWRYGAELSLLSHGRLRFGGGILISNRPETITAHPCVFATLTAPSFGPVDARRMRGKTVLPYRPRRDAHARRCPHGRDISCPTRHAEEDPRLGQPMCGHCYDYDTAVLFNAYAGDLWRRFTTYLPRHLARLAGVAGKELRAAVRIRYVKVAEYQARGVVHFHAMIRLDGPGEDYQPGGPVHPLPHCVTPSTRPPPPSASPPTSARAELSCSASARRPTPGPSTAMRSRAPASHSTARLWPTTSPRTPPRP